MLVRLRNGAEVEVRPLTREDKALLVTFMADLSSESVYRRFLAPKPELTAEELERFTEVDFRDHVALVATPRGEPHRLVAVVRWIRSPARPEEAEFAFVVADAFQHQGLGTALVTLLADAARVRGVRRLTAATLPGNVAARRLLARISDRRTTTVEAGVIRIEGDLAA